jgi:predicted amidohydrolase
VLPETFISGFTNDVVRAAETMDGASLAWLGALAAETGAVITGSLVIAEQGRHFNRLIWMRPDGHFEHYDKRHLFRMAGEHEHYASGSNRAVFEIRGWRVLPLVCYDLRFPAWSRNRVNEGSDGGMDYDLVLYVANWPQPRRQAWRTLLRARAIENLSYCIGVNRVGTDGNGHDYSGDSAVIDPLGESLVELGPAEQNATLTLDPAPLLSHRQRFPAWRDADQFLIQT